MLQQAGIGLAKYVSFWTIFDDSEDEWTNGWIQRNVRKWVEWTDREDTPLSTQISRCARLRLFRKRLRLIRWPLYTAPFTFCLKARENCIHIWCSRKWNTPRPQRLSVWYDGCFWLCFKTKTFNSGSHKRAVQALFGSCIYQSAEVYTTYGILRLYTAAGVSAKWLPNHWTSDVAFENAGTGNCLFEESSIFEFSGVVSFMLFTSAS